MLIFGNKSLCFVPILRALDFFGGSALQHFQPTLRVAKKAGRFYNKVVASCQKFFQPNVNSYPSSIRYWVGNRDIGLNRYYYIPFGIPGSGEDSYLLNLKPFRERTMLINRYQSNLGQFDAVVGAGSPRPYYRIFGKLRK
jgi:hypothetical protein